MLSFRSPSPHHQPVANAGQEARRGVTLVEVVIAVSIFVLLAAGILTSLVMSRKSMNQALVRNIAFDAAQGFLDQIKNRNFGAVQKTMKSSSELSLVTNDIRHQKTAMVKIIPNQAEFLTLKDLTGTDGDQRIPINTTNPDETNTAKGAEVALKSMSYIPEYGIRITLSPVTDTPAKNADGSENAIRATVNFRYKYSPVDADFKTGAVSYLIPNI